MSSEIRLAVEQISPAPGPGPEAIDRNRLRLEATVEARSRSDLVVFPELALTGYPAPEAAQGLALPLDSPPLRLPPGGAAAVLGLVERGRDHLVYNTGIVCRGAEIVATHRKIYLPTYGIFDEGRVFARGRGPLRPFTLAGWRVGLLVCEDLWHPALSYLLALQGIDLLLVLAAAPGRGESRDPDLHPLFGSGERWDVIARSTALLHGIYVVVANRTGDEGGHTFAGGSLVVDPRGEVVARAPQGEEATLEQTLHKAVITAARADFSHLRDEDAALTGRELRRLLDEDRKF